MINHKWQFNPVDLNHVFNSSIDCYSMWMCEFNHESEHEYMYKNFPANFGCDNVKKQRRTKDAKTNKIDIWEFTLHVKSLPGRLSTLGFTISWDSPYGLSCFTLISVIVCLVITISGLQESHCVNKCYV